MGKPDLSVTAERAGERPELLRSPRASARAEAGRVAAQVRIPRDSRCYLSPGPAPIGRHGVEEPGGQWMPSGVAGRSSPFSSLSEAPARLLLLESSSKGGEGLWGWQGGTGGLGLSPGDHRRNFGWRVGGTSEELLHHAPVSRE